MEINQNIKDVLRGMQCQLMAAYAGSQKSSNKSKGDSREGFIKYFLENILPSVYRIGRSGDIIDANGNESGEVDIIIENPFSPHFVTGAGGNKLYLAEGVGAVIEVKSHLDKQWTEVKSKVENIKNIKRNLKPIVFTRGVDFSKIPVFVVAYKGNHVAKKFNEFNKVDGILVIESGDYAAHNVHLNNIAGIANFVFSLFQSVGSIKSAEVDWLHYTTSDEVRELLIQNGQL